VIGLDRRLGPLDAAVIVVSNVIGIGIFITPGVVAAMLPNSAAMLGVWAAGGALAFAGALAYSELATRRPQAGGEYVYLRESFGGLAAFLTGWTSFVAGFAGAIAAGAVGVTAEGSPNGTARTGLAGRTPTTHSSKRRRQVAHDQRAAPKSCST